MCFSLFGLISELRTPSKHSIHVTDIMVDCCNILVVTVSSASAVFGAPRRARKTIILQNLLTYVSEVLLISLSSAVSLSLFGLASELSKDSKLSIRMPTMMPRVVGSCDFLAVVATSATGVYGAPNRVQRIIHVLTLLTSVSVPDFTEYFSFLPF